jgi:hypothetical protein
VYGWERLLLPKHLLDQSLTKAAIARQLEVSRPTVHHWITTGQLDRGLTRGGNRVDTAVSSRAVQCCCST